MRLAFLVRAVLAAAALASVGLVATPAAAKCMMPGPTLAPASGTVPPNPVLHLLVPARVATHSLPRVVARLADRQVPVTVTADTAAGDLHTYRIVVTAAVAGPLRLALLDADGADARTWTFTIDPKWQPPPTTTPRIAITHENTRWTCSHQRTRNLRFAGTAAAYRVVFADDEASVVLPADPGDYFRTSVAPQTDINLALGHVSCFGHTLEWSTTRRATIRALLPDGSEPPVTRAPLALPPP